MAKSKKQNNLNYAEWLKKHESQDDQRPVYTDYVMRMVIGAIVSEAYASGNYPLAPEVEFDFILAIEDKLDENGFYTQENYLRLFSPNFAECRDAVIKSINALYPAGIFNVLYAEVLAQRLAEHEKQVAKIKEELARVKSKLGA